MVTDSGCLVLANQTVATLGLHRELESRISTGKTRFYVVVPLIKPSAEAAGWGPMQSPAVISRGSIADAAARDEATNRSLHRLNLLVEVIRSKGGEAEGAVGPTNPVTAVRRVLSDHRFDEVLVSTLPAGMSRWLRMDVPARIGRLTGLPVAVVTAEVEPTA